MTETLTTRCCIVGGGPAGMMLGFLLARAGVDVVVLEKHADFFRDFRGDTIHPSTLELMHELGLLREFLALPHDEVDHLAGDVYGHRVRIADFTHLPVHHRALVIMPQWDFLNFLAAQSRRYPRCAIRMEAEATGLLEESGAVTGVRARTPHGELEIHADLVVGADGRHTTVRAAAGLSTVEAGAPIDVLWFRIPRAPDQGAETGGYIGPGRFLVMINRNAYWQCAFVIPKGGFDALRAEGIEAFRARVARINPSLQSSVAALGNWDAVKLLTVQIDHMPVWFRPGLLCIGDAAHAMSPVGGVGVNLAIQDAVAAANRLAAPLREQRLTAADLRAVQRRREWPARVTQRVQIAVQNRVVVPVLSDSEPVAALPWPLRLAQRFPVLQRIPARLVGIGVRPEHIRTAPYEE
jgi:2-polyprenyl-6-methoxyphenol hydroxylase-like FAD-dependent oxidoreductase